VPLAIVPETLPSTGPCSTGHGRIPCDSCLTVNDESEPSTSLPSLYRTH
jgi:hypothetical protein